MVDYTDEILESLENRCDIRMFMLNSNNQIRFPKDVIRFFKRINGGFNNYIWFVSPFDKKWKEIIQELQASYMYVKTEFYGDVNFLKECTLNPNEGYPFDFYDGHSGILPWALCDNGTVFYWRIIDDKWTILVYGDSWEFYEYDMTTTEFLYKLIHGDLENMYFYLPEDIFEGGVKYYPNGSE